MKDILLSLPSFGRYSKPGDELLDSILAEAKATFKTESPSEGEVSPLTRTRYYLDLAAYIAIEKHAATPTNLLRFYCSTFASRITLMRVAEEMRVFVIDNFANSLSALQENAPKMVSPSAEEVVLLRNIAVDACSVLLSVCPLSRASVGMSLMTCSASRNFHIPHIDHGQHAESFYKLVHWSVVRYSVRFAAKLACRSARRSRNGRCPSNWPQS